MPSSSVPQPTLLTLSVVSRLLLTLLPVALLAAAVWWAITL
ncbi:hypothetical protein [Erwinia sp. V71]